MRKGLLEWAFRGIVGGVATAILAGVIFIYQELMEVKDVVIRLEQEMVDNRRDFDRFDRHIEATKETNGK